MNSAPWRPQPRKLGSAGTGGLAELMRAMNTNNQAGIQQQQGQDYLAAQQAVNQEANKTQAVSNIGATAGGIGSAIGGAATAGILGSGAVAAAAGPVGWIVGAIGLSLSIASQVMSRNDNDAMEAYSKEWE